MKTMMIALLLIMCAAAAIADETCPPGEVYSDELEMCVAEGQS